MASSNKSELSPELTNIILESVSDGVFTVDHDWCITSFNRAAEKITGIPREEALGRRCCEVFRSNMCETDCALRRTMKQGVSYIDTATYIVSSEGRRIPVTVCTALLKDSQGHVVGGVESFRDMSVVEALRRELDGRYQVGDIVSRSPSMKRVVELIPKIADDNSTVLIQGETGTGKELVARAIHNLGENRQAPFIGINCGALPDTLLESELFGYKAGAFTHAVKDKPGHFALAGNGTLFLDEIGDISPAFQVRLLRVLQEKTYTPLGATKAVRTNARIIAASNKDLAALVESGQFRQDLYYRINVIKLELPPLRERKNDIPVLVDRFIDKFRRLKNKQIAGITQSALDRLMLHDYPGNIRELENIIEHAFILCPGNEITPKCFPEDLLPDLSVELQGNINAKLKHAESTAILEALETNGYNRQRAAKALGIHKSTLHRKMKALNLSLPDRDGRNRQAP